MHYVHAVCLELIQGPSPLTVEYGSSAELYCSAKSSQQVVFVWIEVSYGIRDVHHYAVNKCSNLTDSFLVANITYNTSYQCVVTSSGHIIKSQEANITVPSEF